MDLIYISLLYCFLLLQLIKAQSCPGTQTSTGCYVIGMNQLDWDSAKAACQNTASSMNRPGFGHLASITDDVQYTSIKTMINDLIKKQTTFAAIDVIRKMWTGGKEEKGNVPLPNWRWLDDSLERMNYQGCFVHNPSQPDFAYAKQFTGKFSPEICISHCYTLGYSVAATRKGDTCSCGNSFQAKGGTSDKCNIDCLNNIHIGSCGGLNSNQVYMINGSFSDWNFNQPNNFDGYQTCGHVELQHSKSNIYVMGDKFCRELHRYACSVDQVKCDNREPFTYKAGGRCVYYEIYNRANWFNARQKCRSKGGDLLVASSKEIMADLTSTLVQVLRMNEPFWIGMYSRKMMWDDGKEFLFSDFPSSHPINKDYNCIRLVSNQQGVYSWEDYDCSKKLSHLCFIDTVTPLPTTTKRPTTKQITIAPVRPTTVKAAMATESSAFTTSNVTQNVTLYPYNITFSTVSPVNTTDPGSGASMNDGDGNNTLYIVIGVVGGVLLLTIIISVIIYIVTKSKSESFQSGHVHPDKNKNHALPPDSDRTNTSSPRRGVDESSTVTTSRIQPTVEPLPELLRTPRRDHESRFRLEPLELPTVKEKKKKDKKSKKDREGKQNGSNGTDNKRRKKSKKTHLDDPPASYDNAVVDMSLAEHNY